MGELIPIIAITMIFGIPLSAIWSDHSRKVLRMKLEMQQQRADPSVIRAVEELREELHKLKETTLQYDLSFDTALQRMEKRVDLIENRSLTARSEQSQEQRLGH